MQSLKACLLERERLLQCSFHRKKTSLAPLSHLEGPLFHSPLTVVIFGFCEVRIRGLLHFIALCWEKIIKIAWS